VSKQPFDQRHICGRDILHFPQLAFSLGTLLRQDMISEGLAVLVAITGFFEPFGRTTTGFHFWHR
jgi:hypothetical protein